MNSIKRLVNTIVHNTVMYTIYTIEAVLLLSSFVCILSIFLLEQVRLGL